MAAWTFETFWTFGLVAIAAATGLQAMAEIHPGHSEEVSRLRHERAFSV